MDGKEVAKKSMEHTIPVTFPEDETLDKRWRFDLSVMSSGLILIHWTIERR